MIVDSFRYAKSGKEYAFVRQGSQRIFLRNILFVRHVEKPDQIVVVKDWGESDLHSWEPPKGQMEWKEFEEKGYRKGQSLTMDQMIEMMRDGVLRELQEEAKIFPEEIQNLTIIPLSYTETLRGTTDCFRYQFWEATCKTIKPAQKRIRDLVRHPDWIAMIQSDVKEKDAVEWWTPSPTSWSKIRKGFSRKLVELWVHHSL